MPIVVCSNCQTAFRVRDELSGTTISCGTCREKLFVPIDDGEAKPAKPVARIDEPKAKQDASWANHRALSEPAPLRAPRNSDPVQVPNSNVAKTDAPKVKDAKTAASKTKVVKPNVHNTAAAKRNSALDGHRRSSWFLLAAGAVAGLVCFGLMAGLAFWIIFSGGMESSFSIASSAILPSDLGATITESPAVEEEAEASSFEPRVVGTNGFISVLKGEVVKNFEPNPPPAWTEYYNRSIDAERSPFALQQEVDGRREWMLVRAAIHDKKNMADISKAAVTSSQNFPLLKYYPDRQLIPEFRKLRVKNPNLLIREFNEGDFSIARLPAMGILTETYYDVQYSKSRSFVWSEDGKCLFVLQSDTGAGARAYEKQLLKINAETWTIEAAAIFAATDIALCSEGLVLGVFQADQAHTKTGNLIYETDKGLMFPLQSNQDTKHHLFVVDPATLELKYSFPVPAVASLAAIPSSSRVYASYTDSYLMEIDVKSGELIRLASGIEQFCNLQLLPDGNSLISNLFRNGIFRFDTQATLIRRTESQPIVGAWCTISSDGKYLATSVKSDYTFYDTSDLRKPVMTLVGPRNGMATIDDLSKTILISGLDANSQLMVQLIQDQSNTTFILGQSQFSVISPMGRIEPGPNKPTQVFERFAGSLLPYIWMEDRAPYFVSAIPKGKGFIVFTFDGTFVIKTSKIGKEYAFNQAVGPTRFIDVSKPLTEFKPNNEPPQPKSPVASFELAKVDSSVGTAFSFPKATSVGACALDSDTGDLYVVAICRDVDRRNQNGTWVLRYEYGELKGDDAPSHVASYFFPDTHVIHTTLQCVQVEGKKCIALGLENSIHFLDRSNLQLIEFGRMPNPLFVYKEPYASALQVDSLDRNQIEVLRNTDSNSRSLKIILWSTGFAWAGGIEIDSQDGSYISSLRAEDFSVKDISSPDPLRLLRDPLRKLTIFDNVIVQSGRKTLFDFTPKIILETKPSIVGQKNMELVFVDRDHLSETRRIPLPPAFTPSGSEHGLICIENPKDGSMLACGNVRTDRLVYPHGLLWHVPLREE